MNRRTQSGRREPAVKNGSSRWATLAENDVIGIDGDIERLIGLYQMKYGYTHQGANAELVRRLSSLVFGHDTAVLENSCCS